VIADIARHRRNRKGKIFFTAKDAKGAEENRKAKAYCGSEPDWLS